MRAWTGLNIGPDVMVERNLVTIDLNMNWKDFGSKHTGRKPVITD